LLRESLSECGDVKEKRVKKMFNDNDKKFLSVHMKNREAMMNLNKSYYRNRHRNLVKFLISSASDSTVVPACDGNFCGD